MGRGNPQAPALGGRGGLLAPLGPCDLSIGGAALHPEGRGSPALHSSPWGGALVPLRASSLTSGSWVLARIYDPELLFISSGSKRFGWEVFQFPPGLDQTAQISKGEVPSPPGSSCTGVCSAPRSACARRWAGSAQTRPNCGA